MMSPATVMAASGRYRALSYLPLRGAYSKIVNLHRGRYSKTSSTIDNVSTLPYECLYRSSRGLATTVHSTDAVWKADFKLFSDLLHHTEKEPQKGYGSGGAIAINEPPFISSSQSSTDTDAHIRILPENLPSPFKRIFEALRQRDTQRLFIYAKRISAMQEAELQAVISSVPRTTFTELFRALDPFVIAKDADPTDGVHIPPGAYYALSLDATIDDWGVRKLYSQLLQFMLVLMYALNASGSVLLAEEYKYIIRCAGAAGDPMGAKWVWEQMVHTGVTNWRHSESYAEFISARFLVNPLYTSYDKTRKMVSGRSLHRFKLMLHWRQIEKLDLIRYRTRLKRLYFGLNKEVEHAEDLIRSMRKDNPVRRLYQYIITNRISMDEPLTCALIIAFGRAGSLHDINRIILKNHFGFYMNYMDKRTSKAAVDLPLHEIVEVGGRPFLRPTVRLIESVVETYCSNGEIAIALRLVVYISKTYGIPIPMSVWKDLLEWSYIMSSPPVSTAWKDSKLFTKTPNVEVVELIWDMMVSEPYNVQPNFDQYNILIRSLIRRSRFSQFIPYMREALGFYNIQCQEYEDAVIEYNQMIKDGVYISETVHQYQCARFKLATMRYTIRVWCRQFLERVRSFNPSNPLLTTFVPDFIKEFRAFIPNPANYRTSSGYASLLDPAREQPRLFVTQQLPITVPLKTKLGEITYIDTKMLKFSAASSSNLAGHLPTSKFGLGALLTSTTRTRHIPDYRDAIKVLNESEHDSESEEFPEISDTYDDDDDEFY
ncbi:hypothetical protein F5Y11DRAFT_274012 [Daldinia sp. FL1419]|nr:hypothetical protein F5Y11DRAFT_274012 [Daldinia sp. FL1419]